VLRVHLHGRSGRGGPLGAASRLTLINCGRPALAAGPQVLLERSRRGGLHDATASRLTLTNCNRNLP
jgi:hypothetical protein